MKSQRSKFWFLGVTLSAIYMLIQIVPSLAASVTPTLVSGNPNCATLAPGTTELKVDPPGAGIYTDGTLTVTITNYTGTSFDWSANISVDAVFVKAGNEGNLYVYNPEVYSDTFLISPNQEHAISHISFCYDVEPPTNTPTNTPTYTPTNTPTDTPTNTPTNTPTDTPTNTPTDTPTNTPTDTPTNTPTDTPTNTPTNTPTDTPTNTPTYTPTYTPTNTPTYTPTYTPTKTPTPTFTPTPVRFEGCTPGYWKQPQHLDSWVATGYSPNQTLESVFNIPDSLGLDNVTLQQGLSLKGGSGIQGASQILLRAAVAALLNSAHPDVDYPRTTASVIADVNAALASGNRSTILNLASALDADNNRGCPLN
jgi:hypothetical protein